MPQKRKTQTRKTKQQKPPKQKSQAASHKFQNPCPRLDEALSGHKTETAPSEPHIKTPQDYENDINNLCATITGANEDPQPPNRGRSAPKNPWQRRLHLTEPFDRRMLTLFLHVSLALRWKDDEIEGVAAAVKNRVDGAGMSGREVAVLTSAFMRASKDEKMEILRRGWELKKKEMAALDGNSGDTASQGLADEKVQESILSALQSLKLDQGQAVLHRGPGGRMLMKTGGPRNFHKKA